MVVGRDELDGILCDKEVRDGGTGEINLHDLATWQLDGAAQVWIRHTMKKGRSRRNIRWRRRNRRKNKKEENEIVQEKEGRSKKGNMMN